jgi:hypothetical protein
MSADGFGRTIDHSIPTERFETLPTEPSLVEGQGTLNCLTPRGNE